MYRNNSEHEQIDKPLSVTTQAYSTSFPRFLQQKSRVRFAIKSDAISMKVTTCPTEEVFEDPFHQDLESLFLKEDAVSAKSSSKDTTTVEAMNTLVEPIELVEDTKVLLADISGQLSSIGTMSQGSDQHSQAEIFGPVEAPVQVKNKGVSDEGNRNIDSFLQMIYVLGECVQTDNLYEVKRPKTKREPIIRPSYQSYNPGGGNTGHFHQV